MGIPTILPPSRGQGFPGPFRDPAAFVFSDGSHNRQQHAAGGGGGADFGQISKQNPPKPLRSASRARRRTSWAPVLGKNTHFL
jgi:hypothetical protein